MIELTEHPALKLIKKFEKEGLVLDYKIYYDEKGQHKKAAVDFIKSMHYSTDETKMQSREYRAAEFFRLPEDPYNIDKLDVANRAYGIKSNYSFLFLEPPYGNDLIIKDFELLDNLLFPSKEYLKILLWNNNWSDYFDDGLEWWGAYLWTVYDSKNNIMVVIGASSTD